jgi:hypothetical protein
MFDVRRFLPSQLSTLNPQPSTLIIVRLSPILSPAGQPIQIEERPLRPSSSWMDLYEAADRRDFRGYFYIPQLTPSEQMDWLTYRAIVERSDWLHKNVGAVTMVIDTLSLDESGTGLWPKWITGTDDYDTWMTDQFHYTLHDPRFFSADAQQDAYSSQYCVRRSIRLHGDLFGQLLRPQPGARTPQVNLIPGYLVENSGDEDPESGWTRGVLRDSRNRVIRYRVRDSESETGYRDVPAEDMLHFHDPFLPGQIRGMPALASVAKKMFRREDIATAIANGTLQREQLAWALETERDNFLGGPGFELPGATGTGTVENSDGSKYTVQKLFGWNTREQTRVPVLPKGYKLKAAESNRPGTQVMEHQDSILREFAFSTGYPPEYVFFIGGMGQGTVARLVIEKVRGKIAGSREFQLKPQFTNRYNVFYAWQTIKSGVLDELGIKVPDNWWKHKIVPVRDTSVDMGREGRLYDERVETGKMSIDTYHGFSGEDSGDVEDENTAIIRRRCKKLNKLNDDPEVKKLGEHFGYFDAWPRSGGNQNNAAPAPPAPVNEPSKNGNTPPGGSNGANRLEPVEAETE